MKAIDRFGIGQVVYSLEGGSYRVIRRMDGHHQHQAHTPAAQSQQEQAAA